MRALLLIALLAASTASGGATSAPAVVGTAGGFFLPGTDAPVVVQAGGRLVFVNTDPVLPPAHSVVDASTDVRFSTQAIGFGESAEVAGVSALAPGSYPFYCHVHPSMTGVLLVVD